jgi:hypothetical protein
MIATSASTCQKLSIDDCRDLLPDTRTWPHHPVMLQDGTDTSTSINGILDHEKPLPIGIPFEFESPLFKGTALIRIRSVKSDNEEKHNAYFEGRKRLRQVVVQGKFKQSMNMATLYYGDVYSKPLKPAPPRLIGDMLKKFFRQLVPGVIMDLSSDEPKVMALYAGCAHSLRIDNPGEEPDITDIDISENTELLGKKFASASRRKKLLSRPDTASKYGFDTQKVYTFHNYDNLMDMGKYKLHVPVLGKINMTKTLNGQPLSISAMTQNGQFLYNFRLWHDELIQK